MALEKTTGDARSKRDTILDAARTLFTKKGYEETTIADIAKEAGVAVGTVYLYFRNKRAVYTGVAVDIECKIADAIRNPELLTLPFTLVPAALVDAIFHVSREHMNLMCLLQIDMQSLEEEMQHKKAHQQITDALGTILQTAINRGELASFNVEMYAHLLNLMGSHVLHQCFAIEKGERKELYQTYFTELIERLFFGPSLRDGYPDQK